MREGSPKPGGMSRSHFVFFPTTRRRRLLSKPYESRKWKGSTALSVIPTSAVPILNRQRAQRPPAPGLKVVRPPLSRPPGEAGQPCSPPEILLETTAAMAVTTILYIRPSKRVLSISRGLRSEYRQIRWRSGFGWQRKSCGNTIHRRTISRRGNPSPFLKWVMAVGSIRCSIYT